MTSRSDARESAVVSSVVAGGVWFHRQVPGVVRRLQAHVKVPVRSLTQGSSNGLSNERDRGGRRSLIHQGMGNGPPRDRSLLGDQLLEHLRYRLYWLGCRKQPISRSGNVIIVANDDIFPSQAADRLAIASVADGQHTDRSCRAAINVDVSTLSDGRPPPVIEPGLDSLVAAAVSAGALRATESLPDGLRCAALSLVCVGSRSAGNGRLGVDAWDVKDVIQQHKLNIFSAYVRRQSTPQLIQRLSGIDDPASAKCPTWSPPHQGGACTERPDQTLNWSHRAMQQRAVVGLTRAPDHPGWHKDSSL